MGDVDRAEVLAYAEQHSAAEAAEKFGLSAGTIRSWRHRQGTDATAEPDATPAVKPGDASYQVAPVRGGYPASLVLEALAVADKQGPDRAAAHIGASRELIAAWQARAQGEDPAMPDREVDYRFRHAWPVLPPDVRHRIALDIEAQAWRYLEPDMQHLRIVWERQARERAEREATERQERADVTQAEQAEQAAKVETERLQREQAEANRARVQAQREQAAAESERMRRASEDMRRNAA